MAEYVEFKDTGGPRMFGVGKFRFSTTELYHLVVAFVMITLTLMVFWSSYMERFGILKVIPLFVITVGTGFLLHEFAHKFVAQHYGHFSEFRGDFMMLGVGFLLAFFTSLIISPLIFLAPGAVMIHGRVTNRQNGIISVAGPWVNLALSLSFLLVGILVQPMIGSYLELLFFLGVSVNAFLGVFNMLPFWVLDGKKVLAWSGTVYTLTMIPLVLLWLFGAQLL